MKKTFNIFIIFALSLFVMTSCEKKTTTEDTSIITHYVTFQLDGETVMKIPLGQAYVEPGYTAMEGETDVTGSVDVSGSVDETNLGLYTIDYSAVNADGYSSSTSRTVIVYDPNAPDTDISGTYTTKITRTESDGSDPRFYDAEMNVTKITAGIFYVDCLLGGTYSIYYGYGSNYAMTGYIALNADNTIDELSSHVIGWGDSLEGFQNGVYNPNDGSLYWESIYAGGDIFAVTGTK